MNEKTINNALTDIAFSSLDLHPKILSGTKKNEF